jgi:hypothetical protein
VNYNTAVRMLQGGNSLVVASGGEINVETGSAIKSGTKSAILTPPAGITIESRPRVSMTHRVAFPASFPILFGDNSANGGNAAIDLGLPAGLFLVEGVYALGVFTATAGLAANSAVVWSIGTTAAANTDATLTSTEANVVASQSMTLSSSIGAFAVNQNSQQWIDTSSGGSLFLNFATPDAGISGAGTANLLGTIFLALTRCD